MPRVAVYLVLPLVIVLAAVTRWTDADVTLRLSGATYDEAVYATSARLVLHGILPYRDFFFGHPPVGAFIFSPAMLLDSTAWGGPNAFAAARQLSLDYGLISVVLVFAVGYRLAGLWGATAASLVWSLDPRAVGLSTQVILDGPMVMFSFAALLAYLAVHPALAPETSARRQLIGLALAGALATLSALTKAVGVTVLIAIVIDLAWQRLRPGAPRRGLARNLGSVVVGVGAVSSIALLPFVIAAPGELIRQGGLLPAAPTQDADLADRSHRRVGASAGAVADPDRCGTRAGGVDHVPRASNRASSDSSRSGRPPLQASGVGGVERDPAVGHGQRSGLRVDAQGRAALPAPCHRRARADRGRRRTDSAVARERATRIRAPATMGAPGAAVGARRLGRSAGALLDPGLRRLRRDRVRQIEQLHRRASLTDGSSARARRPR